MLSQSLLAEPVTSWLSTPSTQDHLVSVGGQFTFPGIFTNGSLTVNVLGAAVAIAAIAVCEYGRTQAGGIEVDVRIDSDQGLASTICVHAGRFFIYS